VAGQVLARLPNKLSIPGRFAGFSMMFEAAA
jgi:hypothetical protein